MENLIGAGVRSDLRELEPELHAPIRFVIAARWVAMELGRAEDERCDRLRLGDRTTEELESLMGVEHGRNPSARLLGATLGAGMERLWTVLKQKDGLWDRMYPDGGATTIKLGTKDLMLENQAISPFERRQLRAAYGAYWTALGALFAKAGYAMFVAHREPDPHRIAIAHSWV